MTQFVNEQSFVLFMCLASLGHKIYNRLGMIADRSHRSQPARSAFGCDRELVCKVAQWKRAGPITQRSVDRNYALLSLFMPMEGSGVPLAQRIARWTSNPKVLGSIPRWDDLFFFLHHQLSGWPSGLRRQTQG